MEIFFYKSFFCLAFELLKINSEEHFISGSFVHISVYGTWYSIYDSEADLTQKFWFLFYRPPKIWPNKIFIELYNNVKNLFIQN